MAYLDPTEYIAYGLAADTSDDWVAMASSLIEAHCRRPSLLITQYVERIRLTAGSQTVRLSYRGGNVTGIRQKIRRTHGGR